MFGAIGVALIKSVEDFLVLVDAGFLAACCGDVGAEPADSQAQSRDNFDQGHVVGSPNNDAVKPRPAFKRAVNVAILGEIPHILYMLRHFVEIGRAEMRGGKPRSQALEVRPYHIKLLKIGWKPKRKPCKKGLHALKPI